MNPLVGNDAKSRDGTPAQKNGSESANAGSNSESPIPQIPTPASTSPVGKLRAAVGVVCNTLDTPLSQLAFGKEVRAAAAGAGTAPVAPTPPLTVFEPLLKKDLSLAVSKSDHKSAEVAKKASIQSTLRSAVRAAWRASPSACATRAASSVAGALLPYATAITGAKLTDSLISLSSGKLDSLRDVYTYLAITAGIGFVAMASSLLNRAATSFHSMRRNQTILTDLRGAVVGFSPAEQESPEVSRLVTRALQSQFAIQRMSDAMFDALVPIASVGTAVGILAGYNPAVAGTLSLFAVLYLYHSSKLGKERLAVSDAVAEPKNRFGPREWNFLSGPTQLEMKFYQQLPALMAHIEEQRKSFDNAERKPEVRAIGREVWVQPLNYVATSVAGFAILMDLVESLSHGGKAGLSIGSYGLLVGALWSLNGALRSVGSTFGQVLNSLPEARFANGVMKRGAESRAREEALEPSTRESLIWTRAPGISVKDLRFAYPGNGEKPSPEILRGLNFDIRPEELLGVVGLAGSGKTTLISLLAKIHDAPPGTVEFDGRDISTISRAEAWHNSGVLRQTSVNLYSMTLRENLQVGATTLKTDTELLEAAERTGLKKALDDSKASLNTVLGQWFEGGISLSGGQNVLLALTRTLLRDRKFLILDEPTANLDAKNADHVLSIVRGMSDVTRIVISHDFGIAKKADRILVLKRGEVEAIGTHDELVVSCPTYAELYALQSNRLNN